MTERYRKPLPMADQETAPFWEGCRRRQLLVQRCRHCGRYQFYPRSLCGACFADGMEWVPASGRGEVYTFTVTHQNRSRGFRDEVPYVVAYVQLEEGVRLMTNIVGCPPEAVHIGMPVEVVFEEATEEITLPKFRPRGRR